MPCKDLLLLVFGRGQGKRKYPVVQTLVTSKTSKRGKHYEWSEYRSGVEDEVPEMGEGNKRHLMVVVGSVFELTPGRDNEKRSSAYLQLYLF